MVTSDFKGASSIPTIKGRSLPWVKTINASVAKFSDDGEEAAKLLDNQILKEEMKKYEKEVTYESDKGLQKIEKKKINSSFEMTVDDDLSDWDTGFDSHIGNSTIGDEEAGTSVTVGRLYANAGMMSSPLSVGKGTDEKGKNRKDVEFGVGGKVEAGFTAAEADAHVRYGDDIVK